MIILKILSCQTLVILLIASFFKNWQSKTQAFDSIDRFDLYLALLQFSNKHKSTEHTEKAFDILVFLYSIYVKTSWSYARVVECKKAVLISSGGLRERGADIAGCTVPIGPIIKHGHAHLASGTGLISNSNQERPVTGESPKQARSTQTINMRH